MGKPTNAQLTEKNKKLVELVEAQETKIKVLEEDLHGYKVRNQELLKQEDSTKTSHVDGIDSLAAMFTHTDAFMLNDKPKYEFERIFFTFQRNMKEVLVVKAEKIIPVDELEHVQGSVLYNRYVDHAKKLQEESDKALHGIQLSFIKY